MDKIVYAKPIADKIKNRIKDEVLQIMASNKRLPQLVVLMVGNDVGSATYVRNKEAACKLVGFKNTTQFLEDTITEEELIHLIQKYNEDESVDGILVQLPLPKHIDTNKVLFTIDPTKDVDGFHPLNIGKMMIQEKTLLPCTPKGILHILDEIDMLDLSGLHAVVIGRSNIVGKPIAQLLLARNATVTITHSKTKDLAMICQSADILVAAVGVPKMVKKNYIKEGAVVIDVGMNRGEDGKLCGDVDLDDCINYVKYITPVPKGVGVMTIAMLLENTMEAYKERMKGE